MSACSASVKDLYRLYLSKPYGTGAYGGGTFVQRTS